MISPGLFLMTRLDRDEHGEIEKRDNSFISEIVNISAEFLFYQRNPENISENFILSAESKIYQRNVIKTSRSSINHRISMYPHTKPTKKHEKILIKTTKAIGNILI
jgi:hypothetical protein